MKFILFCNLPYAFSILKPLEEEILSRGFEVIWYIPQFIEELFPYKNSSYTTKIDDLKKYNSDCIFVPGNDVPHFLRGLKVQVFHGLAGEKKGHFHIRDYFDLYLTQGPYFTSRFKELATEHKNFNVIETGWCKLDTLYHMSEHTQKRKEAILKEHQAKNIILYSPTFSPSLTSGLDLLSTIQEISLIKSIVIIIKFHDKMDKKIIEKYKALKSNNIIVSNDKDITSLLQISDLMISDTSSVVYEFILLNKPVVTLKSISKNITWLNVLNTNNIVDKILSIINGNDNFAEKRLNTIKQYHPYNDGKSASRMIDAAVKYIEEHGVPNKRKISLFRKFKMHKKYSS